MPNRRFSVDTVVFDKDGVLVDSEGFNLRSAHEAFREAGHELDPAVDGLIVGRHPVHYLPELLQLRGLPPERAAPLMQRQSLIYDRLWKSEGRLMDGALEAIDAVRARGLRTGMATSSDRREVEAFLDRFDLRRRFEITLTLDDVQRAKPDPEMYVTAARLFGIEPSRMLVIEDSEYGVRAAKQAGAVCVALRSRWVPAERITRADHVIDTLGELAALL